jgi:hypothetical protein
MDFEDYALGGVGAGAGLALGSGVIGKYIGNKWGEDAYYRSKARSLGRESDANVDYDQQSRALLESNLPEKQKIRELQKLKVQRDRVIGDSTRNRESDAEVSRWLNKAKGIGVGTLGAGAVGGAIGLGYGLNNDFSGDKQHFANFNKNNKSMTKFTRKHDSTYIQFKRAYNKAVAEFGFSEELLGDYVGGTVGGWVGKEIGRGARAESIAKGIRRSVDPREKHNQILAAKLEAAQKIEDPVQRERVMKQAQKEADYNSAKIQRFAEIKGGLRQTGLSALGVGSGVLGNTIIQRSLGDY